MKRNYSSGKDHPNWKDDDVGYKTLHVWVRKNKPKPEFCEICKLVPPREVANISGEYKRDIEDFQWLCSKCHWETDIRRKEKMSEARKGNKNCQGRVLSNETRAKIGNAHKGKVISEDQKKKISESQKGKELSEVHKKKLLEANTGNSYMLGKQHSDETKAKMKEAWVIRKLRDKK